MIDPVTRRPIMVSFDIDNQFMPNPDLQSEKATQIEIGTRYQRSNVTMARNQLLLSANAYGTSGEPRFKAEIGEEKLNYVADRAFLGSKDLISLLNSLHGA